MEQKESVNKSGESNIFNEDATEHDRNYENEEDDNEIIMQTAEQTAATTFQRKGGYTSISTNRNNLSQQFVVTKRMVIGIIAILIVTIALPLIFIYGGPKVPSGKNSESCPSLFPNLQPNMTFHGRWAYRSFHNLVQERAPKKDLIFAIGTFQLFVDKNNNITGWLLGADENSAGQTWALRVEGYQSYGIWENKTVLQAKLVAFGYNKMASNWVYEYIAYMVPTWDPVAPFHQEDSWVGSVRRVCCHEPIGYVASSAATRVAKNLKVRKNILSLSLSERQQLFNAINLLKNTSANRLNFSDWSIYDNFVEEHNSHMMSSHKGPAFFPWHRKFLLRFETALRNISGIENLTLAYWDWSNSNTRLSIFTNDYLGGNGTVADSHIPDGPFAYWNKIVNENNALVDARIQRAFGTPLTTMSHFLSDGFNNTLTDPVLPDISEVMSALMLSIYDTEPWNDSSHNPPSFRNTFEGWEKTGCHLHNTVHLWVGGQMRNVSVAPNDPLFWFHHAFVDKVWNIWQQSHYPNTINHGFIPHTGARPGHNIFDRMEPYGISAFDVLSIEDLGYTYESDDYLDIQFAQYKNRTRSNHIHL